jgi:hypothetical protein
MELLTDALTYAGNLENLKDADEAEITTVYPWRYNGFSTLIIEASYIPIPPHLLQNPMWIASIMIPAPMLKPMSWER